MTSVDISRLSVANRLAPESYVTMESALGYLGWLQEEPETPEIIVNTEKETKEESAEYIVHWLEDKGYIRKIVVS